MRTYEAWIEAERGEANYKPSARQALGDLIEDKVVEEIFSRHSTSGNDRSSDYPGNYIHITAFDEDGN